MKTSQNGLKILKEHEGLASKIPNVDFSKNTHKLSQVLLSEKDIAKNITIYPYKCSAGKLTIGWGHTKTTANYINGCTVDKCEELLKSDLVIFENAINNDSDIIKAINGNQNKFDALVCLTFNIGCSAFAKSTVRNCIINNESKEAISEAWQRWNKITVNNEKKENLGLVKRRKNEIDLFFLTMETKKETSWIDAITKHIPGVDLVDLGLNVVANTIPGGGFVKDLLTGPVKDVAKQWLGKNDVTEQEFTQAIENATPEQLSNLKELLAQVDIEREKTQQAIEKTLQEKEDTKQSEHQVTINQILHVPFDEQKFMTILMEGVIFMDLILLYLFNKILPEDFDFFEKCFFYTFMGATLLPFGKYAHPKITDVIGMILDIVSMMLSIISSTAQIPKNIIGLTNSVILKGINRIRK